MSYKNDIRTLTTKAIKELNEVNAKIKDLKKVEKNYYKPRYEELMKELTDVREALIAGTIKKATELADNYKKGVREKLAPKGEELTADAALLTSGINLTGDELNTLFDKYKGNYTMQRLISEYASKNDVKSFMRVVATEAVYNDAADHLLTYTKSALSRPEYADLMLSDDYFKQITPDVMREE